MTKPSHKKDEKREDYYVASQWQLMWRKFKKHTLAMVGTGVLGLFYVLVLFSEFISPYGPYMRFSDYLNAQPQRIRFLDEESGFQLRPFVYDLKRQVDPDTFRRTFVVDTSTRHFIYFFVRGEPYKMWDLIKTDVHLFSTRGGPLFLFGTDKLGRDVFSRNIYASRISLTIGLVGVTISILLGMMLGGLAGYFGGTADAVIMRVVDLLVSIPTIPLWMALAAAVPRDWSIIQTYFAITLLLSVVGWTGLARVIRGKLLSLREEDFTLAAKISGASEGMIIVRHLLPSFFSYLIVHLTLSIPAMILGETALSFLGLGIQPPAVSWGTLLQDAQHVRSVAQHPWLLIPCISVIVSVLMFNFVGDGLRDAADPYE